VTLISFGSAGRSGSFEQQSNSTYRGNSPALLPIHANVTVPFHYGDTTSVLSYLSQDTMDLEAANLIATSHRSLLAELSRKTRPAVKLSDVKFQFFR
jgi:hypothetical protein